MTDKPCNKKIATNYRVKEPISNFKLRVKIVQQRPLLAELLENEEDTTDTNFLEAEDRIFSWQEKVFSPFEIKFYSDEKNCLAEHQQKYHRQIKEKNVQGYQLYSYTETDSYYSEKELLTKPHRTILSMRNQSALPALQNLKPFAERYNKAVVDDKPSETRIRSNHYFYTECSTMHVMADLSRREETSLPASNDDLETMLCTVTYDRVHKILTINPDFTGDEQYYTVTNSSGVKFNYYIEHASEKQSPLELQQQQNDLRREIKERLIHREAELSHGLQLPPPNTQKIFLQLDILSAHDFFYDGLFVTYYIDLPEGWSTNQQDRLFGRTQRCNLRNKSAYFSYATDISLECKIDDHSEPAETLPRWPRLLISVASLDSWTRYRTEGYAAIPLPNSPGSFEFNIQTWRPTGSIINSLRRFFTGGTYELEDITFCGIPTGHDSNVLNKSNVKVVSSGSVKLNMNIIHQRYALAKNRFQSDELESLSTDTLMNNIENIFEQFKLARERMIQIRNLNI